MLKATADSNIYISALQFGGQPLRFLDLARTGAIELAISLPIIAEVERPKSSGYCATNFNGLMLGFGISSRDWLRLLGGWLQTKRSMS